MSHALKCPNPSCPYLFDPSRVPPGAVLSCPRCGMRFTLGPPAASAPTVPPPLPPPDGPPEPLTEPAADRPTQAERGYRPPGGGSSTVKTILGGVIVVALMTGTALTIYFAAVRKHGPGFPDGTGTVLRDKDLSFEPPGSPWEPDEELRVKLAGFASLLAYKRAGPEAHMVFGAKDFKDRSPRPGEVRALVTKPLDLLFENIKTNDIPDARWLGQRALGLEFRAQLKGDGPTVVGEAHAVGHKGIGYWLVCWAGENDYKDLLPAVDGTRGRFRLLGQREWAEKEAPVRPFGGHRLRYQVLDAEGLWAEPDPKDRKPADEDPKADLLLVASVKEKGRDRADEATLVVLILDGAGGDPLAQGRKYVEDRRREEVQAASPKLAVTFAERTGEPEGDPTPNTVEPTAPVVRLRSTVAGAKDQTRLVVLSAIKMDDKVVVAHAWCDWEERAVFESKLIQIAGSLRDAR